MVVAMLVLLAEMLAAVRAACRSRIQISLDLTRARRWPASGWPLQAMSEAL
jgi:Ca2+/H+ antiporter